MDQAAESGWREGERAREAGLADAAAAAYRRCLALAPDFMPARANLALGLTHAAALVEIRRALALASGIALLHLNLGNAWLALGRAPAAAGAFRRALGLDPAYGEAWLNLGVAVHGEGLISAAEAAAERAIALRPAYGEAWNNLANAKRDQGFIAAAISAYERARAFKADYADAARNRLAARLYLDDDDERAAVEAEAFVHRHGPSLASAPLAADLRTTAEPLSRDPRATAEPLSRFDPDRRIRVGLLSSDLRDHPVGRNLASFFRHRDRRRIWLACYATGPGDRMSQWFKSQADLWRDVAPLSDLAIANLIRADEIDVLAVLAGRFDQNRPLVAAFRAAPVQVAMHDGGPSGMGRGPDPAISAWITDAGLHPLGLGPVSGGDRLLRLPLFYSFPVPDRPPDPRPPDPGGAVILASFSNPAKLSGSLLEAWGRILGQLPTARLRLKYRTWYADPKIQARVLAGIGAGIGAGILAGGGDRTPGIEQQIEFLAGAEDAATHLARYGAVDLALDPFPFSGATTSFEALAMGVPVLTLAGLAAIGRTTAALLGPLGLDELVAVSPADYVARAVALAQDRRRLLDLRGEVVRRLSGSPLLDGEAHALALAGALRRLWQDWCRTRRPG